MKSFLFYGGQLVQEFNTAQPDLSQYLHTQWGLEVYNNGITAICQNSKPVEWYRSDRTPILLEDVPKDLRILLLLLL